MNQAGMRKEFQSFTLNPTKIFESFQLSIPDFLQELFRDQIESIVPQNMAENFWFSRNEHRDMYLQINYMDVDLEGETIEEVFQRTTKYMDRIMPNFQRLRTGSKISNGILIACMDYKSSAIDGDKYTIPFMFSVNGKCFSGDFTAPLANQAEWMQIFLVMIDTLTAS